MDFSKIVAAQRLFFDTRQTYPIGFRKQQLKKLKNSLLKHSEKLYAAIDKDFGKSKFDTYTTELALIFNDIDFYIKNLHRLARAKRVRTNLANLPGTSKIYYEPLGCTLVIGAWNYPYLLSLTPAIAALAAGNTVILKPSEIASHTSQAMAELIHENFPSTYFTVIEGGAAETTALLKCKFDKIFFTGSSHVGKIVYEAAAKNLTPVTLELGGKSPTLITASANLKVAAKRIAWGKFLNAGQTCVAPDYLLIHEKIEEEFLYELKQCIIKSQYSPQAKHYPKIINLRNTDRLLQLIDKDKIFIGGKFDRENRYLEPTILRNVDIDDAVMQEEIFGPILPTLQFQNFDEALSIIKNFEKPLSAYLFTNNKEEKQRFTRELSFGGGCINDVVMHLSNEHLPFGGVGMSGIGNYHGEFGFKTFSHLKSVLNRATWGEPNFKYPPYTNKKLSWIKKFL